MERFSGAAHGQVAVPDSFESDKLVGEILYILGLALDYDYFKAVIMIHVDMGR